MLATSSKFASSCQAAANTYWRQILDGLRRQLIRDSERGARFGGPTSAGNSALRILCHGGQPTAAELPPISADEFAALRRLFDSSEAIKTWNRLDNAWPGCLLGQAGGPLASSLLEELERQVGLEQLAVGNPGLLANMAESRLRLLGDAAGSKRYLMTLAERAHPAVRQLLTTRVLALLSQMPDSADLQAVWTKGNANTSNAQSESFDSKERLFAYLEAAGEQRHKKAISPLLLQKPWDLDELLVNGIAQSPSSWGDIRQLLLEPACQYGLVFSQPAALRLAKLLLEFQASKALPPSAALEATADRRCPACSRSLSDAYFGSASSRDELDAAGLANRLLELRQSSGQLVWRTDPDEVADFRQWLRHKTNRYGRPGGVFDLNNLLLSRKSRRDRFKMPDFAAIFADVERQLPLSGRPLGHLVFVGKLGHFKFLDEFFEQFRQYASRAPVPVSMYLLRKSECDDLLALYTSLLNWPSCYMFSNDQFKIQRKFMTPAERRVFQRWQSTCQVTLTPWSRITAPNEPYQFTWPPGYPMRSLAHPDGSAHLLCAPPDAVTDDLSFWPTFRWVCVPKPAD